MTRPVWQERKLEKSFCRFSVSCDKQSTREHVLLGSLISYVMPRSQPLLAGPHRGSFFFRVVSWFFKSGLKVIFQCVVRWPSTVGFGLIYAKKTLEMLDKVCHFLFSVY